MSALEWVVIGGAGIGGYAIVSWIINRSRPDQPTLPPDQPAPPPPDRPAAPPPAQPFTSAWDEFNRK